MEFPADVEQDSDKRHATSLIRLLTRLIFCWFLKEKGLIPDTLFVEAELKTLLNDLSPDASSYYQAVLQNLFFATLNQRMGTDGEGKPYRAFAHDEGFFKNRDTYGVYTLYRYEEWFQHPDDALKLFADVPFLNGGLFECLDRTDEKTNKKLYLDGFSRNKAKRPQVPNHLFLAEEQTVDLSAAYGENKRKNEKVRGLLHILHAYKFTIVENTPIDQEIALDPELLGKVFENLLASYNEETKTTARKHPRRASPPPPPTGRRRSPTRASRPPSGRGSASSGFPPPIPARNSTGGRPRSVCRPATRRRSAPNSAPASSRASGSVCPAMQLCSSSASAPIAAECRPPVRFSLC